MTCLAGGFRRERSAEREYANLEFLPIQLFKSDSWMGGAWKLVLQQEGCPEKKLVLAFLPFAFVLSPCSSIISVRIETRGIAFP